MTWDPVRGAGIDETSAPVWAEYVKPKVHGITSNKTSDTNHLLPRIVPYYVHTATLDGCTMIESRI